MNNKDGNVMFYIEGVNSYLKFLINNFNNTDISIPDKESLISSKIAIISNILLNIKESLVENVGNLQFSSKLFDNYLEENVSIIANKTNKGYIIDGYLFCDAGSLVATIRNKMAHGKYAIDYKNNYVEIYHDNQIIRVDIDKLVMMVVVGLRNMISVNKQKEISRCISYSDKMLHDRVKKLSTKSELKGLVRSFKNIIFTIKSRDDRVIDEETLEMFKLLRENFGNVSFRPKLLAAFEKGLKGKNYQLIKTNTSILEKEIDEFVELIMARDNDNIKTYEEQYKLIAILLQKHLNKQYNQMYPLISGLNNLFLIDSLNNNLDIKSYLKEHGDYIQNCGINEIAFMAIALFNSIFVYSFDDIYKNANMYISNNCLGLDYSLLDVSLFNNVSYLVDNGPVETLIEQKNALLKNIVKYQEMLKQSYASLGIVSKKNNVKAIGALQGKITILENKVNQDTIDLNNITTKMQEIATYCSNNSLYLKNRAYIEGIRNAIAHGNFQIVEKSDFTKSKIIFKDIYEGKVTFQAEISIADFIKFLDQSRMIVSNFFKSNGVVKK